MERRDVVLGWNELRTKSLLARAISGLIAMITEMRDTAPRPFQGTRFFCAVIALSPFLKGTPCQVADPPCIALPIATW